LKLEIGTVWKTTENKWKKTKKLAAVFGEAKTSQSEAPQ
jgi:hypothetical protein